MHRTNHSTRKDHHEDGKKFSNFRPRVGSHVSVTPLEPKESLE